MVGHALLQPLVMQCTMSIGGSFSWVEDCHVHVNIHVHVDAHEYYAEVSFVSLLANVIHCMTYMGVVPSPL